MALRIISETEFTGCVDGLKGGGEDQGRIIFQAWVAGGMLTTLMDRNALRAWM